MEVLTPLTSMAEVNSILVVSVVCVVDELSICIVVSDDPRCEYATFTVWHGSAAHPHMRVASDPSVGFVWRIGCVVGVKRKERMDVLN